MALVRVVDCSRRGPPSLCSSRRLTRGTGSLCPSSARSSTRSTLGTEAEADGDAEPLEEALPLLDDDDDEEPLEEPLNEPVLEGCRFR